MCTSVTQAGHRTATRFDFRRTTRSAGTPSTLLLGTQSPRGPAGRDTGKTQVSSGLLGTGSERLPSPSSSGIGEGEGVGFALAPLGAQRAEMFRDQNGGDLGFLASVRVGEGAARRCQTDQGAAVPFGAPRKVRARGE